MIRISGQPPYRGYHIGNARGRIALWLDKEEATILAGVLGSDDLGSHELCDAIESAYPEASENCDRCGHYSRGLVMTNFIVGERTLQLLLCGDCRDYMGRWNRHAMAELSQGRSPVPGDPQIAEALRRRQGGSNERS